MSQSLSLPGSDAIILFANNPWDGVRMADVHMATALSEFRPVLFVDPPTSHIAALRKGKLSQLISQPRVQMIAPNLARVISISLPGMERRGISAVTSAIVRRQIASACSLLDVKSTVLVACSAVIDVFGCCDEHLRVFWAQDDYVGGAKLMGLSPTRIAKCELRIARRSNLIIVSSPTVAQTWTERGFDPLMIPFGCDADAYASVGTLPPAHEVHLAPPIALFVGHINDRIDLALLSAVVDAGMSLLLVGPCDERFEPMLRRLLTRQQVQWVGRKPADQLGPYMQAADVALVPYVDSAFNRGSFPLKTLEYLAAGLPVVSTDLPSTRWFQTDLISIATGPVEFSAAVLRATESSRDADTIFTRRQFAHRHTWKARAMSMMSAFESLLQAPTHGFKR